MCAGMVSALAAENAALRHQLALVHGQAPQQPQGAAAPPLAMAQPGMVPPPPMPAPGAPVMMMPPPGMMPPGMPFMPWMPGMPFFGPGPTPKVCPFRLPVHTQRSACRCSDTRSIEVHH